MYQHRCMTIFKTLPGKIVNEQHVITMFDALVHSAPVCPIIVNSQHSQRKFIGDVDLLFTWQILAF